MPASLAGRFAKRCEKVLFFLLIGNSLRTSDEKARFLHGLDHHDRGQSHCAPDRLTAGDPRKGFVTNLHDRYMTVIRPLRPLHDRWSPARRDYAIMFYVLGAFLPSVPGCARDAHPGIKTAPGHGLKIPIRVAE